ncbi:unnamed protein product, partial [Mycena citricolor]
MSLYADYPFPWSFEAPPPPPSRSTTLPRVALAAVWIQRRGSSTALQSTLDCVLRRHARNVGHGRQSALVITLMRSLPRKRGLPANMPRRAAFADSTRRGPAAHRLILPCCRHCTMRRAVDRPTTETRASQLLPADILARKHPAPTERQPDCLHEFEHGYGLDAKYHRRSSISLHELDVSAQSC